LFPPLPRQPIVSRALVLVCGASLGWVLLFPASALGAPPCHRGKASRTIVGGGTAKVSWRAGLLRRTSLFRGIPRAGAHRLGAVGPRAAQWLLVLRAARDRDGRCWLKVRLPSRPNAASGWLDAGRVVLRRTAWRIAISRARRRVTVFRGGRIARRFRVVVGAPPTPTPKGLFSIIGAWRSAPGEFLGSYVLPLTAHSDVLREFDGGDGRGGLPGRGGASLLDPLGTARSHGCIRLANADIDWLVRAVGAAELPGTPVRVR
jgi:hypothetical protein